MLSTVFSALSNHEREELRRQIEQLEQDNSDLYKGIMIIREQKRKESLKCYELERSVSMIVNALDGKGSPSLKIRKIKKELGLSVPPEKVT